MIRTFTKSLYYGAYPYRLQFYSSAECTEQGAIYWDIKALTQVRSDLQIWKDWLSKFAHRTYESVFRGTRIYYANLNVYMREKSQVDETINKFDSSIISLIEPMNSKHLDQLLNDHSIVLKDSLFYKKYRYSITFNHRSYDDPNDVIGKWVENSFVDSADDRFLYRQGGWNPILYLSDENDVIMAKICHEGRIKKIVKVALMDEV